MYTDEIRHRMMEYEQFINVDVPYTFYYDESNNVRKLYLKDSGLNVEQDKNFVLAGIAHTKPSDDSAFDSLFDQLSLQKSAKELKLKHVARGGIFDMLKSRKLQTIFNWLSDNGFYIHYFNLNPVYWSIVDIIDSIVCELNNVKFFALHLHLKSDLYELAMCQRDEFLKQLSKFEYPDIKDTEEEEFCSWIIDYVKTHSNKLPSDRASMLTQLVEASLNLDDLPFISGFHGRELIKNFMIFYLQKLYIFKESSHIFDEEEHIQNLVDQFPLYYNEKRLVNYHFVKSHSRRGVQISDVIAGFLGKYFSYIKDVNEARLISDVSTLNENQLQTLQSLMRLIDRSDARSRAFFTVVTSEGEKKRHQYLCQAIAKRWA